jgi:predicted ATPase
MILKSINYGQHEGQESEWRFKNLNFPMINLMVGKNASGKSRVLNVINGLANMLSRETQLQYDSGNYELNFISDGNKIEYNLKYENREIQEEKFIENGEEKVTRSSDGTGSIYSHEMNKTIKFKIPKNEFAITTKRDEYQHPFLEQLNRWAEQVVLFRFGTSLGKDTVAMGSRDTEKRRQLDNKNTNLAVAKFINGQVKVGDTFVNAVISDMNAIGYELEKIEVGFSENIKIETTLEVKPNFILVKESGISSLISQIDMSQGMFRALSLIIQINHATFLNSKNPEMTILIDDIGEGLDFERANLLVGLLLEKAEKHSFQLIMTTNDRFIMNKVPLNYWTVIDRIGSKLDFYNYENSKALFQKFELTGLSNFDMFSSKYYLKK